MANFIIPAHNRTDSRQAWVGLERGGSLRNDCLAKDKCQITTLCFPALTLDSAIMLGFFVPCFLNLWYWRGGEHAPDSACGGWTQMEATICCSEPWMSVQASVLFECHNNQDVNKLKTVIQWHSVWEARECRKELSLFTSGKGDLILLLIWLEFTQPTWSALD